MKLVLTLFSLIYFFCSASQVVAIENETRELRIENYKNLQSRVLSQINARKISDINTLYGMTTRRFREKFSLDTTTLFPFSPTANLMAYFIEAIRIDGDEAFVTISEVAMQASVPAPRLRRGLIQKWKKENMIWCFDPPTEEDYTHPDICGYAKQPKSRPTPRFCGR